jgi:Undecaprenyl-phosphate galactose phosphotransferase WbaP
VALLDDDPNKHGTLRAHVGDEDIELRSIRGPDLEALSIRHAAPGHFSEVEGIPVVGGLGLAPVLAERLKIHYAVMAMPGVESPKLVQIAEQVGGTFSHVLLIPDLFGFASLGVPARDLGGVLGLEVRQQLLLPWPRFAKRLMDVAFTLMGSIFVAPVLAVLALLVKLDSKGPIFYRQSRLGRDGTRFQALKFRTMHGDGEKRLAEVLAQSPKLRAEYEQFHKLSKDPRVTRIGHVLRKYSFDELPQLWNVLMGDMSLVGPRPYLEREIPEMNHQERIILRATPGITGMWQVSERNATTFEERVKMDVHYVRNWSPWLDLYLLARTFGVVLGGTGS